MTLLTIGIPTYNRAKYLEKLLDRIIPACEGKGIEVLVSDNCSTDDTPRVTAKFSSFTCFRSLRNRENIDFDGNILNLLDKTAGKFLWLMGDDDNIEVEKLPEIIKLLQNNPAAPLLFISYRSDNAPPKNRSAGPGLKYLAVTAQHYVDNYLHRATLISTDIINLDLYRKVQINRDCIDKHWIHLHLLLLLADQLQKTREKIIIVKDKVVVQGSENNIIALEKWVRLFIYDFSFTLENTTVKYLSLRRFLKRFYDINIRPRFLTAADLIHFTDPLDHYRMVVKTFNMNLTGRLSFWLQYLIIRKSYELFKRLFRSGRGQNRAQ